MGLELRSGLGLRLRAGFWMTVRAGNSIEYGIRIVAKKGVELKFGFSVAQSFMFGNSVEFVSHDTISTTSQTLTFRVGINTLISQR